MNADGTMGTHIHEVNVNVHVNIYEPYPCRTLTTPDDQDHKPRG